MKRFILIFNSIIISKLKTFRLSLTAIATAKSLQSCPTLCDPIDGSPPGSPFPGILQAITLEWVAISFSNAWKWNVKVKSLSRILFLATPWTAAHQAPPPMGFSRQEYWSGVPLPSPIIELRAGKCLWNPKVVGFRTIPAVEHFVFNWSYSSYRTSIRN